MRQGTWSATPPPTPPFFAFTDQNPYETRDLICNTSLHLLFSLFFDQNLYETGDLICNASMTRLPFCSTRISKVGKCVAFQLWTPTYFSKGIILVVPHEVSKWEAARTTVGRYYALEIKIDQLYTPFTLFISQLVCHFKLPARDFLFPMFHLTHCVIFRISSEL